MNLLFAISFVGATAVASGPAERSTTPAAATTDVQDVGNQGRVEAGSGGPTKDPSSPSARAGGTYDGSAGQTEVRTPRHLTSDIEIDGVIDETIWKDAALLQGFTQYDPSEGAQSSQRTEVRLFSGKDALFIAIRAFDSDPKRIRATLAQRDKITESDDWVRIILDTFDDQRRAYVFTVNPLGVQHDGLWIEGKASRFGGGFGDPIDDNPDFLWTSAGRLEDWGYAVELRVPYKSLRFRKEPRQQWGLQVVRNIQRFGFKESWSPITAGRANKLTQAGKLLDLEDMDPGLFMEINPELTGRRIGLEEGDTGDLSYQNAEADFGVNFTYGVTPNLRFDATYNPDFSQVEADAGQIAVNERFAIFFPEKRPFFLEGTEIFNLPQQLVYTRTIVDPVGGAKLTGKVGGFDLGYLGAVDRAPDLGEAGGENIFVSLLRARRDLGESSTLGLIYTDRTQSKDEYNRVAGADARVVFARRYTLQVMGAGSVTGAGLANSVSGSLFSAKLNRSGRTLVMDLGIEDTSPDFRASSGFLRRIGDTHVKGQVRYNFWGEPGAFFERWGPTLEAEAYWDHDAFWDGQSLKEGNLQLRWSTSMKNNFSLWLTASSDMFDYRPQEYDGLFVQDPADPDGALVPFYPDQSHFQALNGFRAFLFIGGIGALRGRLGATWKDSPIFDRLVGVPVETASAFEAEASITLYPTRSLNAELGLRYLQLDRQSDGSRYSTAAIPRIRVQYQFSKAWYVRSIVEYGSQDAAELRDPATGDPIFFCGTETCDPRTGGIKNDVYGDILLGYEPSPGTVFYIGYTRQMRDSDAFRFREINAVADGLFAKVSYRFRL